ncbi:ROK family protein [Amycolatopsis vancoresmycina]|uniref:ROK family protein n=1 Tax=Amycolatopsis vancoresmycina TaxID=208444 RepID=UPI0023E46835|nr:ROK family protein [Amycolatopsis vancoresmycina]
MDIGGTKVAFRFEHGEPGAAEEFSFAWPEPGPDAAADLRLLGAEAARTLPRERITAVGVSVPATLDGTGRVLAWPMRPSWTGVDFGAALRSLFPGVPVRAADDGDLAAIAEAKAAGCADLVYFGVGSGIGGGIVLDGRSWPGFERASCELGHVVVDRAGARCDCGRRGCVQALASGPATLRRATRLRGSPVTPAQLRAGLGAGEPWAVAAVTESARALAVAVVSAGELCAPAATVIGGGFAAGVPDFVPLVAGEVRRLARPGRRPAPVRPAVLGGLSSLHGAVAAARELGRDAQAGETSSRARAASR